MNILQDMANKRSSSGFSIDSTQSHCAMDDRKGREIREKLRDYRSAIIDALEVKLTVSFLLMLLNAKIITEYEHDKLQRTVHMRDKASTLVHILSEKRGTDLKVFVDQLKILCPRAYNILHVPEPIDCGEKKESAASAVGRLEWCLHDPHHGLHKVLHELRLFLETSMSIKSVIFANGNSVMHEVVQIGKVEYLWAIFYAGVWDELFTLRTHSDQPSQRLTPIDLAKKLNRTKMEKTMAEINAKEAGLRDVDRCLRAGNVLLFHDLKLNSHQHLISRCGRTSVGDSLLEYACQSNYIPMVLEVIKFEQDFGNQRSSGDNAVVLCVTLGHHLLLEYVVCYVPVSFDQIVIDGRSPMEKAAINGDIETFLTLQQLGAQPSNTVIGHAAVNNRLPFLQALFTRNLWSYNLDFQDKREKNALLFAAENGNAEVVLLLVENGSDITITDKRNYNILHSAVSSGKLLTVEAVLKVCEQHRPSLVNYMLKAYHRYLGGDQCFLVRGRDNTHPAWHYVKIDRGLIDIFRHRTQEGSVDVAAFGTVLKSGWGVDPSPEISEEVNSRFDVVNAKADAPPDQQPLHVSIMKNHEDVSLKLISIMDDVGQADYFGLTPLHLAAMRGSVNVIKALLDKGVDVAAKDARGRTPFDIATANRHDTVRDALMLPGYPTQQSNLEDYRSKLLKTYTNLSHEKLAECTAPGENRIPRIKALLRDIVADTNDFLYDTYGEGPIAPEVGSASGPGGIVP